MAGKWFCFSSYMPAVCYKSIELSLIINGAFRFSTEILRCSTAATDMEEGTRLKETRV